MSFLQTNSTLAKGCLILENLKKKKVPIHAPKHYPPKKILLKGVICIFFWRFEPKWKTFLEKATFN